MKAIHLYEPGKIEDHPLKLETIDTPDPRPGEVRIRVNYCGVCHTDLHIAEGEIHPSKMPIIPGHQVVGRIDKVGAGVDPSVVDKRVGMPWFYDSCRECQYCQSGRENLCESAKFTGFDVDGGYAEYMIAPADRVLYLPDGISDLQAAPLLCAGIIGYRSIRQANVNKGERVGLFGFGASAHLAIQVLNDWGCRSYVFTRSEKHRQHARDLGAEWVAGAEDTPPEELDRAVIFAPAGWIVHKALEYIRPGGTVAINAIHMSPIPEMPYELIYGERTLRSVANATYQDGVDFIRLAAEIGIQSTVTEYSLKEANKALEDIKHSRINGEAVLYIEE
jgi:propanol-preferring alcohol dehydrogenase